MGNRGGDSAGGASTLIAVDHITSLQEQLKQAERSTQEDPQSGIEKDKAPAWMKEALERWEREDS